MLITELRRRWPRPGLEWKQPPAAAARSLQPAGISLTLAVSPPMVPFERPGRRMQTVGSPMGDQTHLIALAGPGLRLKVWSWQHRDDARA